MTEPKACPTCPQPQPRGLEGQGGSEISWPPWSQSRKGIGWQNPQKVTVIILHFKLSHSGLKAQEGSINLLGRKAERKTP